MLLDPSLVGGVGAEMLQNVLENCGRESLEASNGYKIAPMQSIALHYSWTKLPIRGLFEKDSGGCAGMPTRCLTVNADIHDIRYGNNGLHGVWLVRLDRLDGVS